MTLGSALAAPPGDPCAEPDSVDHGIYGRILRYGWSLLVLATTLGCVAGAVAGLLLPKTYEARARVLVSASSGLGQPSPVRLTDASVNLDTESQIITSDLVLADVAKSVGKTPMALAKAIDISVPPNSSVLTIAYSAPSTEEAIAVTDTLAAKYLANRIDLAAKQKEASRADISKQIDAAATRLGVLEQARLAAAPQSADALRSEAESDAARTLITGLYQSLATLDASPRPGGLVIQQARISESATKPNRLMLLVSGGVLGGLSGLIVQLLRERLNSRLRTPADVRRELHTTVAGVVEASDPAERRHQLAHLRDEVSRLGAVGIASIKDRDGSAALAEVFDASGVGSPERPGPAILLLEAGKVGARRARAEMAALNNRGHNVVGAILWRGRK